ncbi:MAG TPA: zf-HC2 domain-containing protein [Lacisediminihabitans sp.]|uniref:anti-sigma factor family protein n=1 Tax=Lacisediminihabitans sp. TaxID=2787631 RepID=UPI002EDA557E
MTDCGCEKAKSELEEYLHKELSAQDFTDISEHLATCEDCTAEHLVGITLTKRVQKACRETAPADLRHQVLLRLREMQASH